MTKKPTKMQTILATGALGTAAFLSGCEQKPNPQRVESIRASMRAASFTAQNGDLSGEIDYLYKAFESNIKQMLRNGASGAKNDDARAEYDALKAVLSGPSVAAVVKKQVAHQLEEFRNKVLSDDAFAFSLSGLPKESVDAPALIEDIRDGAAYYVNMATMPLKDREGQIR